MAEESGCASAPGGVREVRRLEDPVAARGGEDPGEARLQKVGVGDGWASSKRQIGDVEEVPPVREEGGPPAEGGGLAFGPGVTGLTVTPPNLAVPFDGLADLPDRRLFRPRSAEPRLRRLGMIEQRAGSRACHEVLGIVDRIKRVSEK